MAPSDKAVEATLVPCEVCLKEIPKSEASGQRPSTTSCISAGQTAMKSGTTADHRRNTSRNLARKDHGATVLQTQDDPNLPGTIVE
jgi:hypothetical protein